MTQDDITSHITQDDITSHMTQGDITVNCSASSKLNAILEYKYIIVNNHTPS